MQILLFHNWQFKVMHRKDIERQTAAARSTHQVMAGTPCMKLCGCQYCLYAHKLEGSYNNDVIPLVTTLLVASSSVAVRKILEIVQSLRKTSGDEQ